ncbi:MarR family winged helix-turn-helix transcriptional regulator [Curtobacterium sp. SORGH_AS_0776]|uniref:MarR family winged helix-turn-helix transcriptional regulator n=1 Tax=Curtobacterium sp. SORGH_AS_0776 TaxID=3041798 RepID=UPI00285E74CC|nr:MarR family winged helix-turn-helix transcriptional regulator [Curtobacterium sp. SORGH_AS_0776]MDR6170445.1 DNA-binding MarR family transcriptional regulator [Curtobacterium sp. SORGH_AS_0776]
MQRRLSDRELDTWQRLQVVTERLRRRVGADLRSDADLSEPEFTVLAHLVDMGGAARPTACAAAIGWDSSRLAHQLRRLERRELVERRPDPGGDARGSSIAITTTGRAAHRAAVGSHLRAASTWFGEALDDAQLAGLDAALRALDHQIRRLDGDDPGDDRPEEQEQEQER